MVLTGKSIDRKDKLMHFFFSKNEGKKALGACLRAAKEFHGGEDRSRALAGWVNALGLTGSGEQCPDKQREPRRGITDPRHTMQGLLCVGDCLGFQYRM